jgi:uncharacterized membrane protein
MIITRGRKKSVDFTVLMSWFLIYSFLGWVYETMYCSLEAGHYVNRGFLFGPFIPIYGLCIVSAILLLSDRCLNKISLFIGSAFIASFFEYLTSLWMEVVFGRRWWDYSGKFLNINGRICLGAAVVFGIFGVVIIKYLHPNVEKLISNNLQDSILKKSTHAIFLLFVLDALLSFQKSLM